MQDAESLTPQQITEVLKGSTGIEFAGQSRAERYAWTEQVLVAQQYGRQERRNAAPSEPICRR